MTGLQSFEYVGMSPAVCCEACVCCEFALTQAHADRETAATVTSARFKNLFMEDPFHKFDSVEYIESDYQTEASKTVGSIMPDNIISAKPRHGLFSKISHQAIF
ncbi:MAG: hypothetical protein HY370_09715 [Proteobacteria bacterium]|nr:hypothetical protein [Pseudomonadota bacterium]